MCRVFEEFGNECREEGRKEGYAEGFKEGYAEGLEEWRSKGREELLLSLISKKIKKGIPLDDIAECLDITSDEALRLSQKLDR